MGCLRFWVTQGRYSYFAHSGPIIADWAAGFWPSIPVSQLHGRRRLSGVRLPPPYHHLQIPRQLQSPEKSPE
jgi:hypothetical protein